MENDLQMKSKVLTLEELLQYKDEQEGYIMKLEKQIAREKRDLKLIIGDIKELNNKGK